MEPRLLHIETSGPDCSLALSVGNQCLDSRFEAHADHNAILAIAVGKLLQQQSWTLQTLDAICVDTGPGAYTALRIGIAFAKGLAFASKKPLISINSLQALASASRKEFPEARRHLAIIDARRCDVYYALYEASGAICLPPAFSTLSPEWPFNMDLTPEGCALSGSGTSKWPSCTGFTWPMVLASPLSATLLIDPAVSAFLRGDWETPHSLQPTYLRDPNITQARKKC
ncbi:MAG: tRNA (adenosine(37)-N6)-threonylcarbamoyltransferase complex dimerization subunit type 1 TsaB [Saprospiraceae bacterium]|nr:tRNA (adenosine(37)-N6)-threonylcarbamoyltransferase complex dimerization subunit type 1 TsaB [Saprospiraceae bacterium]